MASGLAGKVRRSTESDEFDLSGYDQVPRCAVVSYGIAELGGQNHRIHRIKPFNMIADSIGLSHYITIQYRPFKKI